MHVVGWKGLVLHILTDILWNQFDLFHELDDGYLHFLKNGSELRVGHDDFIGNSVPWSVTFFMMSYSSRAYF